MNKHQLKRVENSIKEAHLVFDKGNVLAWIPAEGDPETKIQVQVIFLGSERKGMRSEQGGNAGSKPPTTTGN